MSGHLERRRDPAPRDALARDVGTAARIERVSSELERLTDEAAELVREAEADAGVSPGAELVPTEEGAAPSAGAAKAKMGALRSRVARKQDEILAKRQELQRLVEEQLSPVQAEVDRLQRLTRRLEEGIWTVNLYLGRDEQIVALADGETAPADEPITVRQLVLAMDQECAVAAAEGGMDAIDVDRFDAWLVSDPAHVEQVMPEKKGVVALVPRFGAKDYGDPWKTTAVAKANEQTYFLIRNGEKLYRTWTDFNVGRRLVPARDEFTSFFEERRFDWKTHEHRTEPIKPGTAAWARAEEGADARRRHFMRVALILQGLVDRTTVFHPLPEDDLGVGFLDERHYFADRVRIVMDAEPALASAGHEPFRDWQRRLNAALRPGMRLVGNFRGEEWRLANDYERRGSHGHSRLHPPRASDPESGTVYEVEERKPGGALVFRYERTDEVWDPDAWRENPERPGWGWRGEWRRPKTRASCTVYPDDRFVLPFDLAEAGEMERFLRSRLDRGEYLAMFPVLKEAIRAKRVEESEEEPFRRMLAGVLARENGVDVADAVADVPALVGWWKHANRHHRPLVGAEGDQRKAVRAIVAEHARRLGDRRRAGNKPDDPAELAAVRRAHPDSVLVARKRDASWVVLIPERAEGTPDANVFVREVVYGAKAVAAAASSAGVETPPVEPREDRRWRLVGSRPHRWRVLYEGPRWAGWDLSASAADHLTDPEMEALAGEIVAGVAARAGATNPDPLLAVCYFPAVRSFYDERCFGVWTLAEGAAVDEDHPLTGRLREPRVDFDVHGWRRGRGGIPLLGKRRHPMGRPARADGRYPGVVLRANQAAEERLEAERARYQKAKEAHQALRSRAAAYERSIVDAWEERARREAYEKFVHDYGDPDLWEGHLKTLNLRYPHRMHGTLSRVVGWLVEDGVSLDGMTVGEAYALAKERGLTGTPGFGAVPEDLAGFRFSWPGDDA